jgi:hypothetical protein
MFLKLKINIKSVLFFPRPPSLFKAEQGKQGVSVAKSRRFAHGFKTNLKAYDH